MAEETKRYAVVTGANRGIGFGICQQLASNGIVVILTARDEKRGLQAVQKLKESGFSDSVVFHQLDVTDSSSVAALVDFIRTQFGKLDILVNNAGVGGVEIDGDALKDPHFSKADSLVKWYEIATETYELAKECLCINYYGAKRMVEAVMPLLQLSDSPRIVNVSSSAGMLKFDVADSSGIAALADFIKTQFVKLDILIISPLIREILSIGRKQVHRYMFLSHFKFQNI